MTLSDLEGHSSVVSPIKIKYQSTDECILCSSDLTGLTDKP